MLSVIVVMTVKVLLGLSCVMICAVLSFS